MQTNTNKNRFRSEGVVPHVRLGLLKEDQIETVSARRLFAGCKSFVIGVPGAYTPVCNEKHVPKLVQDADGLKAAGFDIIACIATNDPFVLQRWSQELDPDNKVMFLSDGNLEFASALNVVQQETGLFLGMRSERYSLSIDNSVIKRFQVEPSIFDLTCTDPANAMCEAEQLEQALI